MLVDPSINLLIGNLLLTCFLTQGTVKNDLSDIYAKLGTNDRAEALLLLRKYV